MPPLGRRSDPLPPVSTPIRRATFSWPAPAAAPPARPLAERLAETAEDRVASEAGDVLYHLLVGLVLRQVPLRALFTELSSRFAQSGHEEKASR